MSALHTHFSGQVEHFIAKFPGHTLIFFKGFGVEQIQQSITHSNSLLNNASLLENGYINYEALKDNWITLLRLSKVRPLLSWVFMRNF